MCNCVILDVTVKKILITAFLKKLPFLAKGLHICASTDIARWLTSLMLLDECRCFVMFCQWSVTVTMFCNNVLKQCFSNLQPCDCNRLCAPWRNSM